ncbi:MAG TPA: ferredoxin--NADP reductase [Acidimicrobiia bacterium]|nr:ferredoxin--NADP reductase [Acidimicrobiia bacterium]
MNRAELVVVGSTRAAFSLALEACDAGLTSVALVTEGGAGDYPALASHDYPALASHPGVEIIHGPLTALEVTDEGATVAVGDQRLSATAVAVLEAADNASGPDLDIPSSIADRIEYGAVPDEAWDLDVLVVGGSEAAAEAAIALAEQGTSVVLARGNVDARHLSRLVRRTLLHREAERRLTILWHSRPVELVDLEGEVLVVFDDTGTPDLVFDRVVLIGDPVAGDTDQGPVWHVGDGHHAPGGAWEAIRSAHFGHLPSPSVPSRFARGGREAIEELRDRHYNATITHFVRTHSDLWVVRVKPDHGDVNHEAGQYASLGLGYWEPRADGATDPDLERKWENLVRRSYSISSPVFDEYGYLADPARAETLEFYVVLVPPDGDRIPALTPRLALRRPGDRIYVGRRIVGRYTLTPVRDPGATVVLLGTGTGEAPHNAMAAELLRKGHYGPIVSVVSVRYRADLGYLDTHRRLQERFHNFHYLPLVTRDPEEEKLYVQDVIERDLITDRFRVELDPATTHVFMCGNPAMIGNPTWEDDLPVFPSPTGACQLLHERGFDIDRHGHVGNVHTEKYW